MKKYFGTIRNGESVLSCRNSESRAVKIGKKLTALDSSLSFTFSFSFPFIFAFHFAASPFVALKKKTMDLST